MKSGAWHEKSTACNPSHREFIAQAAQKAFVPRTCTTTHPQHDESIVPATKKSDPQQRTVNKVLRLQRKMQPRNTSDSQTHFLQLPRRNLFSSFMRTVGNGGVLANGGARNTTVGKHSSTPRSALMNRNPSLRIRGEVQIDCMIADFWRKRDIAFDLKRTLDKWMFPKPFLMHLNSSPKDPGAQNTLL